MLWPCRFRGLWLCNQSSEVARTRKRFSRSLPQAATEAGLAANLATKWSFLLLLEHTPPHASKSTMIPAVAPHQTQLGSDPAAEKRRPHGQADYAEEFAKTLGVETKKLRADKGKSPQGLGRATGQRYPVNRNQLLIEIGHLPARDKEVQALVAECARWLSGRNHDECSNARQPYPSYGSRNPLKMRSPRWALLSGSGYICGFISDEELARAIDGMTFDHGETQILVAGEKEMADRETAPPCRPKDVSKM
jgi:hypothetical protein